MKIAIMQPYLFPYIGYFQLVSAVDKFVFYDDVNFIKKGWINRNNVLVNAAPSSFTIPLKKVSQNKLINETEVNIDDKWVKQFNDTIRFNYKRAPFFDKTNEIINSTLELRKTNPFISDLAQKSVMLVAEYLGLETKFEISSQLYSQTKGMEKAERLKSICKINNSKEYINPSGGIELYTKEDFLSSDINLQFLYSENVPYKQLGETFVPWLSIIDIMMFNEVGEIKELLKRYKLN